MRDDWDEETDDGDDDDAYIDCPNCGHAMLEDAGYCPSCEQWITSEGTPRASRPWWVMIGAAVCLLIVLTWIAGR